MYVQGYLQGSENGRVVTIDTPAGNPNNPVVILRFAILTSSSDSANRGRSIIRVIPLVATFAIVPIEGAVLFMLMQRLAGE